jgi:Fe-S oxidoreductase
LSEALSSLESGTPDEDISELIWQCTTCDACVRRCPEGVRPPDIIVSYRSRMVENGQTPQTISDTLNHIYKRSNPWGSPRMERANWTKDLKIKPMAKGTKFLYYVGCAPSYDPRNQRVARALVSILTKAGVDFGILGNDERCCGDSARRLGEEGLFQLLAEENSKIFEEHGAERVVTTSPHSYHVFKNEYPQLRPAYQLKEVWHYSQVLEMLLKQGKLAFADGPSLRVTYHDPCYLGRHNGIYYPPRAILNALPGIELIEMARNRERSFCCGGGGGRMWVETSEEERLSTIRLKEALATGAQCLITACPFCTINFEEAVGTLNAQDSIQVMDLAELVSARLAGSMQA